MRNSGKIYIFIFISFMMSFFFCIESYSYEIGVRGFIRTVFEGSAVSDIKVEITGISHSSSLEFEGNSPSCEVYIIRSLEDKGFFSGCSGSPLYIEDRIAGALSHTFEGEGNRTGVVIPYKSIKDHLSHRIAEYPEIGMNINSGKRFFVDSSSSFILDRLGENLGAVPVSYSENGFFRENESNDIFPGSPVMLSIVSGDMNIGVLGSVTSVENNKIYALGHKAFGKGPVNYFLQNAFISHSVENSNGGYKVGLCGDIIGMIYYDSFYGVAGELGKFPLIIPVRIVSNIDSERKSFSVNIVKNKDVLLRTLDSVLFRGLDSILERKEDLNLTLIIDYEKQGFKLDTLRLEKLSFKAGDDTEALIASKVMNIARAILDNPYMDINITGIKIIVDKESEKKNSIFFRSIERIDKEIILTGFVKGKGLESITIYSGNDVKKSGTDFSILSPDIPMYHECTDFNDMMEKIKDLEHDFILRIRNGSDIVEKTVDIKYFKENFENEYFF